VDWLRERAKVDIAERDPVHDAGGINDDWPVGRGVFIQDNHDFVVLVNFEEHLKILVLREESKGSGGFA